MQKIEGWEQRFRETFLSKYTLPFKYGSHDCCLSVCDCILAITEIDVAKEFRGYKSKKKALNYLRKYKDVKGMAEYITEKFNMIEIPPPFAGRGDVVLVQDEEEGFCLGVIEPNGLKVATAADPGWKLWPREAIIKAWKIG